MPRPATVIATLVVVLLHALLLVGGTIASGLALAASSLTRPGVGRSAAVLLPSASRALLSLLLAAGGVLLVVRVWRAARGARVVLTGWLCLSGLITLGGIVTSLARVAAPACRS